MKIYSLFCKPIHRVLEISSVNGSQKNMNRIIQLIPNPTLGAIHALLHIATWLEVWSFVISHLGQNWFKVSTLREWVAFFWHQLNELTMGLVTHTEQGTHFQFGYGSFTFTWGEKNKTIHFTGISYAFIYGHEFREELIRTYQDNFECWQVLRETKDSFQALVFQVHCPINVEVS